MNSSIIKYHEFKGNASLSESIKLIDINDYDTAHKKDILHRHGFYELQFVWEGSGEQNIDFKIYNVSNNHLFMISPNQIHKADKAHLKRADIVIFKPEYLGLKNQFNILKPNFSTNNHCLELSNKQVGLLKKYLFLFKEEYENQRQIIILQGLMLAILAHIEMYFDEQPERLNYLDHRTNLFLQLVEEDYKMHHTARHYAAQLNVSVKHLNNIISKDLGKTAATIIKERITLEIKRLLAYGKNNHKEIAYELGFKDPYYMSNFFKNQTGIRPSNFEL